MRFGRDVFGAPRDAVFVGLVHVPSYCQLSVNAGSEKCSVLSAFDLSDGELKHEQLALIFWFTRAGRGRVGLDAAIMTKLGLSFS